LLRELVEADMVVLLGRVRPHYFAGFSGGVKALFPGCAYAEDVLENHRLKADPSARLGQTATNRCRLDMEAAAALAGPKLHLLNVLCDCEGTPVAAAAGHPVSAHRALAAEAQAVFAVQAPRSSIVIVADRPPVTRSLYQASKLLPAAAPLLEPGGTAILVAECDLGIGPIERVNEGIYRLGIAPLLPARHRVVLVSELSPAVVRESYAEPASDLASALAEAQASHPAARAVVVWRAGECITRATD
jgi:nickel-dependent lactate racemase